MILITVKKARIHAAALIVVLGLAACGSGARAPSDALLVVATTSVLGDVVSNVVGDRSVVDVLIPLGSDPHDYEPSARELARLFDADLVIANGLGLEGAFGDALEAAAADGANILTIGPLVDPLPYPNDPDALDPHFWMDPSRVISAATIISDALVTVDPDGPWRDTAMAYADQLEAVDSEVRQRLAVIPQERRTMVTNHDSLRYFAAAYDFEIVGTVIPGTTATAEPSSADLAKLVRVIEERSIPAIFAETTESTAMAEAVANEVSSTVGVVELYTGSLGPPGSPASSLLEMYRTNAARIADALA